MTTFNNLPLFEMDIDQDPEVKEGVECVALVARPAIQRSFLAFREKQPLRLEVTSEDRRIVSGPVMLADTPIYRCPPEVPHECYVVFPAAAIERAVKKFFRQGNQENMNLQHDSKQIVKGAVMFESWITDSTRGVCPLKGFEDAPEGSWFGSFEVTDDDVWQQIKSGQFTGFSVEGIFGRLVPPDAPELDADAALLAEIHDLLKNIA